MAFFYRLGAYLSIGALISSSLIPWGQAEVILDGRLGPADSLPGPNFTIPHTVGQTVGTNLFHSFSIFNINLSESSTFTGPPSIDNVISRVTGDSISSINGSLISAIESADFWFINPHGVIFGEHASLDVQGSFHVSTADYLRLGNGGRFDASNPENSVLTMASPEAFGFLGDHPARITVQGSPLTVLEGETLSVIGGNIEITGGAGLQAPSGRVNVASVAAAGEVTLGSDNLGTDSFSRFGSMVMEGSTIDVSGTEEKGSSGGSVFIRGGRFAMRDNSAVLSETYGNVDSNAGDIKVNADSVRLKGFSQMSASTFGLGQGGTVDVQAEDIVLEGGSGLFSVAFSSGKAGDIKVNATNSLQLREGAQIRADTDGSGKGGDVEITAGGLGLEEGSLISAATFGFGSGGKITVKAGRLQLGGESLINAATLGSGKGGNVDITADNLRLEGGGQIHATTFGAGDAGDAFVKAENIILEGTVGEFESGLFVSTAIDPSTNEIPTGHGGTLTINTGLLQVSDGAIISASTAGIGPGGDISIHATDIDLFDGGSITAESTSTGLNVQNDPDAGRSGNIYINVSDTFNLFNGSAVNVATTQADAGDIFLDVGFLLHLRDSSITTSVAGGRGDGGNINIDPVFTVFDGGSSIIARAREGRGGNINIVSDFLFASPDSLIDASSELGVSGVVDVESPETDVVSGALALPESFLDAASLLSERCGARAIKGASSFIVSGRGGVPPGPETVLPSPLELGATQEEIRTPESTLGPLSNTRLVLGPLATDCSGD